MNPILIHPIETSQPHPNLKHREGFGIPINHFWTTWTSHKPPQFYNGPDLPPKIERFASLAPQSGNIFDIDKGKDGLLADKPHSHSSNRNLATSS